MKNKTVIDIYIEPSIRYFCLIGVCKDKIVTIEKLHCLRNSNYNLQIRKILQKIQEVKEKYEVENMIMRSYNETELLESEIIAQFHPILLKNTSVNKELTKTTYPTMEQLQREILKLAGKETKEEIQKLNYTPETDFKPSIESFLFCLSIYVYNHKFTLK